MSSFGSSPSGDRLASDERLTAARKEASASPSSFGARFRRRALGSTALAFLGGIGGLGGLGSAIVEDGAGGVAMSAWRDMALVAEAQAQQRVVPGGETATVAADVSIYVDGAPAVIVQQDGVLFSYGTISATDEANLVNGIGIRADGPAVLNVFGGSVIGDSRGIQTRGAGALGTTLFISGGARVAGGLDVDVSMESGNNVIEFGSAVIGDGAAQLPLQLGGGDDGVWISLEAVQGGSLAFGGGAGLDGGGGEDLIAFIVDRDMAYDGTPFPRNLLFEHMGFSVRGPTSDTTLTIDASGGLTDGYVIARPGRNDPLRPFTGVVRNLSDAAVSGEPAFTLWDGARLDNRGSLYVQNAAGIVLRSDGELTHSGVIRTQGGSDSAHGVRSERGDQGDRILLDGGTIDAAGDGLSLPTRTTLNVSARSEVLAVGNAVRINGEGVIDIADSTLRAGVDGIAIRDSGAAAMRDGSSLYASGHGVRMGGGEFTARGATLEAGLDGVSIAANGVARMERGGVISGGAAGIRLEDGGWAFLSDSSLYGGQDAAAFGSGGGVVEMSASTLEGERSAILGGGGSERVSLSGGSLRGGSGAVSLGGGDDRLDIYVDGGALAIAGGLDGGAGFDILGFGASSNATHTGGFSFAVENFERRGFFADGAETTLTLSRGASASPSTILAAASGISGLVVNRDSVSAIGSSAFTIETGARLDNSGSLNVANAAGIGIENGGTLTHRGMIAATGPGSDGVYGEGDATIALIGGDVDAAGDGVSVAAFGLIALSDGASIDAQSDGIVMDSGTASVSGATIEATLDGVSIFGSGSALVNGGASIAAGSAGVHVFSGAATIGAATLQTGADGVRLDSGTASISGASVRAGDNGIEINGSGAATLSGGARIDAASSAVRLGSAAGVIDIDDATLSGGVNALSGSSGDDVIAFRSGSLFGGSGTAAALGGGNDVFNIDVSGLSAGSILSEGVLDGGGGRDLAVFVAREDATYTGAPAFIADFRNFEGTNNFLAEGLDATLSIDTNAQLTVGATILSSSSGATGIVRNLDDGSLTGESAFTVTSAALFENEGSLNVTNAPGVRVEDGGAFLHGGTIVAEGAGASGVDVQGFGLAAVVGGRIVSLNDSGIDLAGGASDFAVAFVSNGAAVTSRSETAGEAAIKGSGDGEIVELGSSSLYAASGTAVSLGAGDDLLMIRLDDLNAGRIVYNGSLDGGAGSDFLAIGAGSDTTYDGSPISGHAGFEGAGGLFAAGAQTTLTLDTDSSLTAPRTIFTPLFDETGLVLNLDDASVFSDSAFIVEAFGNLENRGSLYVLGDEALDGLAGIDVDFGGTLTHRGMIEARGGSSGSASGIVGQSATVRLLGGTVDASGDGAAISGPGGSLYMTPGVQIQGGRNGVRIDEGEASIAGANIGGLDGHGLSFGGGVATLSNGAEVSGGQSAGNDGVNFAFGGFLAVHSDSAVFSDFGAAAGFGEDGTVMVSDSRLEGSTAGVRIDGDGLVQAGSDATLMGSEGEAIAIAGDGTVSAAGASLAGGGGYGISIGGAGMVVLSDGAELFANDEDAIRVAEDATIVASQVFMSGGAGGIDVGGFGSLALESATIVAATEEAAVLGEGEVFLSGVRLEGFQAGLSIDAGSTIGIMNGSSIHAEAGAAVEAGFGEITVSSSTLTGSANAINLVGGGRVMLSDATLESGTAAPAIVGGVEDEVVVLTGGSLYSASGTAAALGGGNDVFIRSDGIAVGMMDGGGGRDLFRLSNDGSATPSNALLNFETLDVRRGGYFLGAGNERLGIQRIAMADAAIFGGIGTVFADAVPRIEAAGGVFAPGMGDMNRIGTIHVEGDIEFADVAYDVDLGVEGTIAVSDLIDVDGTVRLAPDFTLTAGVSNNGDLAILGGRTITVMIADSIAYSGPISGSVRAADGSNSGVAYNARTAAATPGREALQLVVAAPGLSVLNAQPHADVFSGLSRAHWHLVEASSAFARAVAAPGEVSEGILGLAVWSHGLYGRHDRDFDRSASDRDYEISAYGSMTGVETALGQSGFSVGAQFGYLEADVDFGGGGDLDYKTFVIGGRVGYEDERFTAEFGVTAGFGDAETSRGVALGGSLSETRRADFDYDVLTVAGRLGFDLYEEKALRIGPDFGVSYVRAVRGGADETTDSASSLRTRIAESTQEDMLLDIGVNLDYRHNDDPMTPVLSLRTGWRHGLGLQDSEVRSDVLPAGGGPVISSEFAEGDNLYESAMTLGVAYDQKILEDFSFWLDYEAVADFTDYQSHNASGGLRFDF